MDRDQVLTFNERNIAEFRANGGRIASFGAAPVLLLTTVGARTGSPRTSPMMYVVDEHNPDRVYVFASAAGADTNPAWFHNLLARPQVVVEIDDRTINADAQVLTEPSRAQVYEEQASRYPGFADYQIKTTRPIPVIALTLHRQPPA
jgi:deazaflavin-dependent oxidoreductase (nitroreductase family)